jgi:hypothetical protein
VEVVRHSGQLLEHERAGHGHGSERALRCILDTIGSDA